MSDTNKLSVILNLEHLDYIDSTGLGGLVISYTTLKKAGGALKILNLSKRNVELLVLTKLTTVFELFNDEQDAVNSFFPNRQIRKFDILNFVQQQENRGRLVAMLTAGSRAPEIAATDLSGASQSLSGLLASTAGPFWSDF